MVEDRKRGLTPPSLGMTDRGDDEELTGRQSKPWLLAPQIEILWTEVSGTADGKAEEHRNAVFACRYLINLNFYVYLCVPML